MEICNLRWKKTSQRIMLVCGVNSRIFKTTQDCTWQCSKSWQIKGAYVWHQLSHIEIDNHIQLRSHYLFSHSHTRSNAYFMYTIFIHLEHHFPSLAASIRGDQTHSAPFFLLQNSSNPYKYIPTWIRSKDIKNESPKDQMLICRIQSTLHFDDLTTVIGCKDLFWSIRCDSYERAFNAFWNFVK